MKTIFVMTATAVLALSAGSAAADFVRIENKSDFVAAVSGKKLTRALVDLQVSPGGTISGKGAVWKVKGSWEWQGGYFCRTLNWGGDDLGFNCQMVSRDGNRIRFTADKGAGEAADFTLK